MCCAFDCHEGYRRLLGEKVDTAGVSLASRRPGLIRMGLSDDEPIAGIGGGATPGEFCRTFDCQEGHRRLLGEKVDPVGVSPTSGGPGPSDDGVIRR